MLQILPVSLCLAISSAARMSTFRVLRTLFLVPLILCAPLNVHAQSLVPDGYAESELLREPKIKIVYYSVAGTSAPEIREQLTEHGPITPIGKRGDAYTAWYVRWSWPRVASGAGEIDKAVCTIDITVTLPRLFTDRVLSGDLAAAWSRYTSALAAHEYLHAEHVLRDGPRICEQIREHRRIQGASFDASAANEFGRRALELLRARDLELDRETDHGRKFGARWP